MNLIWVIDTHNIELSNLKTILNLKTSNSISSLHYIAQTFQPLVGGLGWGVKKKDFEKKFSENDERGSWR